MRKTTHQDIPADSSQQAVEGISEITILADGRVYVLGYSKAIQEAMHQADLVNEQALKRDARGQTERKNLAEEDLA